MKDLTKGNPYKLILLFALPVFIGNVFQQLYNMVDTIIVGNTINSAAFTGVGLTGPVSFLVLGFASGLTGGFGVRVAQRFGAGDADGVRRAIATSYILCVLLTAFITSVAAPLTGPLLRLMNIHPDYFDYAYGYLFVIFLGIGATIFYNMTAGILRAIGDSRTPLYFLIAAALLNVALDFAFIVGLRMQYHGAALATVLSQLISGAACLAFMLFRYPELRLKRADWKWSWKIVGGHVAVGLPMALQYSITAIGSIIQQSALNGLPESSLGAATAYVAASKIDVLSQQSLLSLGTAMANYSGQNIGAGRTDRVRKGVFAGMVYAFAAWAVAIAFCLGLFRPLMGLFLNEELDPAVALYRDDIMRYGFRYLLFQSCSCIFVGVIFIFRSTLQGIGNSTVATFAGVAELAGRALTAYVFVPLWGFTGFCISNPVAWIAADIFLVVTYIVVMHGKGKHKKKDEKDESNSDGGTPLSAAA